MAAGRARGLRPRVRALGAAIRPARKGAFQCDHHVVEHDPEEGQSDEHREHQRVVRVGFTTVKQRAKAAAMGRHDLHQVGSDEGEGNRDFECAEELGQGFGQGDLPEDRGLRGPQRTQDIAVFRLQRRQADGDRDSDWEEADHEGDEHGVEIVPAYEHQGHDGHDSCLGHGVEAHQKGVERVPHDPRKAHDHADGGAEYHGKDQPRNRPPERLPAHHQKQVPVFFIGRDQVAGRGHFVVGPAHGPHQRLPQDEEDDAGGEGDEKLTGAHDVASAGARPWATSIWWRRVLSISAASGV
mmetsp:Transcript_70/g.167  ORF Transcript_70/g.167 Transcript_70/m.167 type:complete len:297 (+) Transcript_70:1005-1895(+)